MGDVIGFSDDIQTSFEYDPSGIFAFLRPQSAPYNLLQGKGKNDMDKFIMKIPAGQNTVGLYALDVALDRVKYVRKKIMHKDPETKYYIIILTDGLDNGSTAIAHSKHRLSKEDEEKYIKKLNKKKSKVMGCGKKQNYFQIYPIIFTKGDLTQAKIQNNMSSDQFKKYIMENMEGYKGASKGVKAPDPIYGDNLEILVEEFKQQFAIQAFEFLVPKGYLNKKVRMTMEDLEGKQAWIEGVFVKKGFSYTFREITYSKGLVSESVPAGSAIKAKNSGDNSNLCSVFMIDNLKLDGKPFRINMDVKKINQQVVDKSGYYTPNSEYESLAESRKNAYIMMVIDGSKSFKENSQEAKEKAVEMRQIATQQH